MFLDTRKATRLPIFNDYKIMQLQSIGQIIHWYFRDTCLISFRGHFDLKQNSLLEEMFKELQNSDSWKYQKMNVHDRHI